MTEGLNRAGAALVLAVFVGMGLTGCGSSEADTESASEDAAAEDMAEYKETAEKITDELSLEIGFPDCEWEKRDGSEHAIVYMTVCESDGLILAAGDKSGVKVWTDSMQDDDDVSGWAVLGEDYSLFAIDKGNALRAYDLLGADGEVIDLN